MTDAPKVQMKTSLNLLTLSVSALALSSAANAQTVPVSDLEVVTTASIESRLELDDNLRLDEDSPGDSFIWSNIFSFGYQSVSPIDSLDADIEGNARYWDVPGDGGQFAFDDPKLFLDYERNLQDSAFGFDLFANKVDVDFFDVLRNVDTDFDDGNFDNVFGGGERYELRGRVFADIGQDAPFSLSIDALGRFIDYRNTDDPDLADRNQGSAGIEAGFLINPVLRGIVGASWAGQTSNNDNITNRDTVTLDTGFNAEVNPRTTMQFRIGYSRVESRRGDEPRETDEAVVGLLDVDFDLPNGSAYTILSSGLTENGSRNTWIVGRLLELQTGTLDASIGASNSGDTDIRPVGRIAYEYQGQRSVLTAELEQIATVDDESRDVLNTLAGVDYALALTQLSTVSLSFLGGLTRYENDDTPDFDRFDVTLQYDHQLNRNWSANVGYRYRSRDEEDADLAESNSVFVGIRRDFATIR